jgi:hypothetical protein
MKHGNEGGIWSNLLIEYKDMYLKEKTKYHYPLWSTYILVIEKELDIDTSKCGQRLNLWSSKSLVSLCKADQEFHSSFHYVPLSTTIALVLIDRITSSIWTLHWRYLLQ